MNLIQRPLDSKRKTPQTASDVIEALSAHCAQTIRPSSDFDLNPDAAPPAGVKLREAAVLIGLIERQGQVQVLLTKRSSRLRNHPGQIAFPGGKKDDTDRDLTYAALREAHEEVGLPSELVQVIGALPVHQTVTGFQVTPVLAWITEEFAPKPEANEVDEVFFVPLDHVTQARNFLVESRQWQGTSRQYYAVPYGPYYIWGATARILRGLADRPNHDT